MVSMKDIAQRCSVSIATVSKALNGHQDIGESTRQFIIDTAKEMGYTANSAARALKTNRTYNLGLVFVDLQNSGFMHEYFASTLTYFRIEAEKQGYDISFLNNRVGPQNQTYLQHALYRGVDGVAIICADFKDPMIQELVFSNLPIVTLDHAFHNRMAVLSDNMEGMAVLLHYVYGKGHRRIAYIRGNDTAVTENRMTGFFRACEELKLDIPEEYLEHCEYHEPRSCYLATKRLLALPERPTCILFSDDYSYIGGVNAITEAGLRIPDDISVVGYDGIHMAKMVSPKLTTWEQNAAELGKTAAARLIDRIENPRTSLPEHLIIHGRLLEGESVKQL
ncbi:MAG: LacI family DNA-binding transcriptional regulator [Lachnospiraceae bacterium]|nr:LacI family DNA-binding transcriptional regulator [Lachnospiraceae bacterium]MBR3165271.1 LacI family DNA-binding transcriptional regulator [Lachnospiraceae bacterium]